MIPSLVFVAVFVIASAAWTLRAWHRHAPNVETLLSRLKNPVSGGHLYTPMTLPFTQQRAIDDQMWASVRGCRGVYRMFQNAGILLTLAIRMTQENDTQQNERNAHDCALLRLVLCCSVGECLLLRLIPGLPMPRLIARCAFDQYLDLCSDVRAMMEFQHPALIDRFDRFM